MIPQGSLPFNAETISRLTEQLATVQTCDELQIIAGEAMASINGQLAGITAQMAALQPIMALLTAPGANPAQIVTWITDFISAFLAPYVKPIVTLQLQVAQIAAAVAQLQAAIDSASSRIGSCSISLPPVQITQL